jgi:DinB superfamily
MRTHDEILTQLAKHASHFREIVERVPEPLISEQPARDKWSLKEILCHLIDIQNVGIARILRMLQETNPVIEIYDEERENRERNHQHDDLAKATEFFQAARGGLISVLEKRPAADWQRTGCHPEHTHFTVEFILEDMLDHERKHFDQIATVWPQLANLF